MWHNGPFGLNKLCVFVLELVIIPNPGRRTKSSLFTSFCYKNICLFEVISFLFVCLVFFLPTCVPDLNYFYIVSFVIEIIFCAVLPPYPCNIIMSSVSPSCPHCFYLDSHAYFILWLSILIPAHTPICVFIALPLLQFINIAYSLCKTSLSSISLVSLKYPKMLRVFNKIDCLHRWLSKSALYFNETDVETSSHYYFFFFCCQAKCRKPSTISCIQWYLQCLKF